MRPFLKILRNALVLSSATYVGGALNFVYLIFLTRYLGPAAYGIYSTIFTMLFFGQALMNFGMHVVVVRSVARNKELAHLYFGNSLLVMLSFSFCAWALLAALAVILGYSFQVILLICLAQSTLLFAAAENSSRAVMLGFEQMALPSIWTVVFAALNVGAGALVLKQGLGLEYVILVFWLASLGRGLAMLRLVQGVLGRLELSFSRTLCWQMVKDSFPVAVLRTLQMITQRVDIIMLSLLVSFQAVGYYSAAARVVALLAIFPGGISGALVPHFSSLIRSRRSLKATYLLMARFCIIIAFPLAILTFVFADKIVSLVFGEEYFRGHAWAALQILAPAFFFLVASGPVGPLLINFREKILRFVPYAFAITLANIVLNLILIPKYGFRGAAISTAFCAFLEMVVKVWLVDQMFGKAWILWPVFWRPMLCALLMAAALYVTRGWFFLLSSAVSTGVYVCGVLLTKSLATRSNA